MRPWREHWAVRLDQASEIRLLPKPRTRRTDGQTIPYFCRLAWRRSLPLHWAGSFGRLAALVPTVRDMASESLLLMLPFWMNARSGRSPLRMPFPFVARELQMEAWLGYPGAVRFFAVPPPSVVRQAK